jgi:hypothetical protein
LAEAPAQKRGGLPALQSLDALKIVMISIKNRDWLRRAIIKTPVKITIFPL